jgi:UDPglucose 6-dehydrogenase
MRIDLFGDTLCAQVSAAALAQSGHRVRWYLPAGRVADALREGRVLYREPGLAELVARQCEEGRLHYQGLDEPAHDPASVVFLALQPGMFEQALEIVARLARSGACQLLVNQSTFPVGCSEKLQQRLHQAGALAPVVCLPDTLQEGMALQTFTRPNHILLGCEDRHAEAQMREILRPYNRRRDVIQVMKPREAEFTKLAISGMLATRLSYMNDMALLAEVLHVDIDMVRQGMGSDPRIGESYLYAGCGFGGPGFSSDVMTLTDTLRDKRIGTELLSDVLRINERQKEVLFRKFWRHFNGDVKGRRATLWGAAFKPNTDRVDNGPALKLIEALWAQQVQVHVHDPLALPALRHWADGRGELFTHEDPYEALRDSDALMLVTEWKPYWSPDWDDLKAAMRTPLILDGRNIFDPASVRRHGFDYQGIGRG